MKIPESDSGNRDCSFEVKGAICSDKKTLIHAAKIFGINEKNKGVILEKLKKETDCDSEYCVLYTLNAQGKLEDLSDKTIFSKFKIVSPSHDDTYGALYNDHIDNTLLKFQKTVKGYLPLPFCTLDFMSYESPLRNLNVLEFMKSDYTCFSCVVNTTYQGNPGEHWFTILLDKKSNSIEYFCSMGEPPPSEVEDYFIKITGILNKAGFKFKEIFASKFRHQFSKAECGVYALYYIYSRINGIPYKYFQDNIIYDSEMINFRDYLFIDIEKVEKYTKKLIH